MTKQYGLLVDLDRCVGCHACEVACKQENKVPSGVQRIRVFTIGPKEVNGYLAMDFIPLMLDGCTFCNHRIENGLEPACASSCPT